MARLAYARRLAGAALVLAAALTAFVAPDSALARARALHPDAREKARLLQPQAPLARPPHRSAVVPLRVRNPRRYRALKAAADGRVRRRSPLARRAGVFARPLASVAGGLSGPGLNASQSGDVVPPDTTGAIGPSHYVEIVNDAVAVYDRSTLALVTAPVDNESFMNSAAAGSNLVVSDPQMQWDPRSGRWFYLATAFPNPLTALTGPNYILFGWSKTADPTNLGGGGWCRYSLASDTGGSDPSLFDDYPKLGHDDTHLVFGSQLFDDAHGGNGFSSRIWVLPKPAPGDISTCPSTPPTASTFGSPAAPLPTSAGNNAGIVIPTNTFDGGAAYVVAADDPSASGSSGTESRIMAWHASGSTGLTPDGQFSVNPYRVPPNVPQPSSTFVMDSLDARLTQAVALADPRVGGAEGVWTEQTIADPGAGGGRAVVRWYELLPQSLTLRQQGDIVDPTGYAFNAAISPAAGGDLTAVFYNVGGTDRFPSIRARDRSGALALGALGDETTIATGSGPDNDDSCGGVGSPCRWGDYSGAAPDPNNPGLVWGANQFVTGPSGFLGNPRWATQIFAVTDTPPNAAFNAGSGTARAPTAFDGSPSSDPGGRVVDWRWDFGDGAVVDGPTAAVSHTYATPGTYTVTLQVADDSGLTAVTSRAVTVGRAPVPMISGLTLTHKRFAVGPQRTVVSARAKQGTTFIYRLSEAARMTFTIQRRLPGRRVGRSCKKPTRSNARRRKCTRLKTAFTFSRSSRSGSNRKAFSGRANRKKLPAGSYSARLVAVDSLGGRSSAKSVRFTIVKR